MKIELSNRTGKKKKKARGVPFKKGNRLGSHTNGGSKKREGPGKGYLKRTLTFMEDEGWDAIFELARQDEDRKLKLDSHKFIANYAHGKPKETIDLNTEVHVGTAVIQQFVKMLAIIIKKFVPDFCPHCKVALKLKPILAKELAQASLSMEKVVAEK